MAVGGREAALFDEAPGLSVKTTGIRSDEAARPYALVAHAMQKGVFILLEIREVLMRSMQGDRRVECSLCDEERGVGGRKV
jgi:hypothetical protein